MISYVHSSDQRHTEKSRYYISRFDGDTYQVVDSVEGREICVCSNYDDREDAIERAEKIVKLLNTSEEN